MKTFSLLTTLALSAILFSCNNPQPKDKNAAVKIKPQIKNDKVHIDYTDSGSGDTTLLFVHGWAINKTYWADQVAHFDKKYRVVTIDMGGFGLSGKNRDKWDTYTLAKDVDAVINQLGLSKVVLIGHSMAGVVVLQAAIDEPNKVIGLVGVDNFKSSGGPAPTPAQKKEFTEAIDLMKKDFKKVTLEWFNQALFSKTTTKAVKDRVLNDVTKTDTVVAVATQEQGEYDEAPNLVKSKKKLYLVNSDYQPTDTTGLVKYKIPFMLLNVKGTGHFPMIEAPAEFNKQLEKALADMKNTD